LELLQQHHQPLQPRDNVIGPARHRRGTRLREPALDRRDRGGVGETGGGQAAGLLELHHHRLRQRSVLAVLVQRRPGAEPVERLLQPKNSVHGFGPGERAGRHFDLHAGRGALHLPQHVVGFGPQLHLAPIDRSQCLRMLRSPTAAASTAKPGQVLHRRWNVAPVPDPKLESSLDLGVTPSAKMS
jgi:hypothetical protein